MYTVYIRFSGLFLGLYIGRCGTGLLFITDNEKERRVVLSSIYIYIFFCRAIRERIASSSIVEALPHSGEHGIKGEFNTPRLYILYSGIIQNRKFVLESRNSLPITRSWRITPRALEAIPPRFRRVFTEDLFTRSLLIRSLRILVDASCISISFPLHHSPPSVGMFSLPD